MRDARGRMKGPVDDEGRPWTSEESAVAEQAEPEPAAEPVEVATQQKGPSRVKKRRMTSRRWIGTSSKFRAIRENSICDGLSATNRCGRPGRVSSARSWCRPKTWRNSKTAKRRVVKRKLYPGYIVVHMVINEDTWFVVRETPGIGDFTGAAGQTNADASARGRSNRQVGTAGRRE